MNVSVHQTCTATAKHRVLLNTGTRKEAVLVKAHANMKEGTACVIFTTPNIFYGYL